jgi:hypothetical protein
MQNDQMLSLNARRYRDTTLTLTLSTKTVATLGFLYCEASQNAGAMTNLRIPARNGTVHADVINTDILSFIEN